MNKKFILVISLALIMLISGCNTLEDKNIAASKTEKKLNIVVTFNPLREFAEKIGGDKVEITTIIPKGTEPHDFEPKIRDIQKINDSDIFVYNGLGLEGWVKKAIETIDNKTLLKIDASTGCNLIKNIDTEENEVHGQFDPHIWLSLIEAKQEALNIKDAIVKVDKVNKVYYETNYTAFIKEISNLYEEYQIKFKTLNRKIFVTGHAAFGYFCRDFNLQQNSVENVFSEGEPSPKRIEDLILFCKANKVNTIFLEELASPKVSETLANEIDGKAETIHTIESKEDGKNYVICMKENLEKVYSSLLKINK